MIRWLGVFVLWMVGISYISATSLPQYWTYTNARRAEEHGRWDKAVRLFTQMLANDPDNVVLMRSLADALYHKGEYAKAGVLYDQIGKRSPQSEVPNVWYNQGNSAFQAGRYPEAASWYRKTLSRNPRDVQAKHNLELAQRRMQEKNPPTPPENPPPPSPMLNAMDQMERESRHQRKQTPPTPPRNVERDW